MKRACDSSSIERNNVDRKRIPLSLSNLSDVNIQSLEVDDVIDVHAECETEIITEDGSHITQDEDSLVEETSFGILVEYMNITEPLTKLRSLLEQRTGLNLSDYKFYLQDKQELDATKNLVNQCIQGEGQVQINTDVSIKEGVKKINIVDILKPVEEPSISFHISSDNSIDETPISPLTSQSESLSAESFCEQKIKIAQVDISDQVTRWIMDPQFQRIQEKYKIPHDPSVWKPEHVRHWFEWASAHFNLSDTNIDDWNISGSELLNLNRESIAKKAPIDPGDLFGTHHELLKKFKIVAVLQHSEDDVIGDGKKNVLKNRNRTAHIGSPKVSYENSPGNHTGNNGQIQLWQFLLDLLTDKDCRDFIQWVGNEGEFKLINPEMVAQLWGQRKNKPTMNYEKLSRALRYYYDGEMIAKVHGQRFVYKFVCDLKSILGYDASELNRLVTECALKEKQKLRKIIQFSAGSFDADSAS